MKDHPWLSASADGLIQCICHGVGVLEIKCPYVFKDKTEAELLVLFDSVKSCMTPNGKLKTDHAYYHQVQFEMLAYNATFCDFVVYANGHPLKIDHVSRNEDFIQEKLLKLEAFWKRHIVPELLTHAVEDGTSKESSDTNLYCYCQIVWDGEAVLVGCDNPQCKFKWIHLACIRPKRKTVPKGTWYCRACKKIM